ncbi:hypothetical protein QZH41_012108 [Actinostola sp. cb2023]|nr:hypothetical protein QZH41_012108 [Actinostola sp. cb2023]
MTKASLNFWLIKFIQELTDKDGAAYVEKTMYQIICCLKRYFETNGRADLNPLDTKDVVFQGFRQILDAEMKKSHRAGGQLERCKEEKKPVTETEETMLWTLDLLGDKTAQSLVNTIYFLYWKALWA